MKYIANYFKRESCLGAGRLWASRPRHYDRGGRCCPWTGLARAGNARLAPRPRKHGLELSQGSKPWREPQQSAGRRARPEAMRCAATSLLRRAPRPRHDRAATQIVLRGIGWMRLSALRSLSCRGANLEWRIANSDNVSHHATARVTRLMQRSGPMWRGPFLNSHSELDPAIQAAWASRSASSYAARQNGSPSTPPGTTKRATPKASCREGGQGIGAQNRRSYRRPSGNSPWQDPGKRVAGTTTAGAPIAAMQSRATVAHPTVKQMSSFSNLYDVGP